MKFAKRIIFCLLILISICLAGYYIVTRPLEKFDLGNGRIIKVTDGWAEISLPIYYELYENDELVGKTVIAFESPDSGDVSKLSYDLIADKSKNIFAIRKKTPEIEILAIFDFENDFRYPGCNLKLDCKCCASEFENECRTRYNRLGAILENDNPGLTIERLEMVNY